jgi:hypothetical protein
MRNLQETVHDFLRKMDVVRSKEFLHEVQEFVKDDRDRRVVLALSLPEHNIG